MVDVLFGVKFSLTFLNEYTLDMVVTEIYGSTETSGPVAANMDGPACLPGSVGQKYSGSNNKIINADEDGYGEIVSNGRFVFMGYQKDEIKTKEAFTSDGYFKSGDIGNVQLYFVLMTILATRWRC